ncbi:hypothetical protein F3Y22_tig00112159pilonHSYRG00094 [Hibiscus syriacus]|uniref:Prolamin-like domain-containing protein n=1 Tax=Hibiscus syriacus TaxID=106335 RepID=A0A6A2X595_HIBSY|nr:hypothetical protein F3Y22_tig00112159pilonHSYRG00094 [Hibiscus syriacus]
MGSFQQHLLLFAAIALTIAITPVFSVLGWEERYTPDPTVCWAETVIKVDGCQHDIFKSLVENKIKISFGCCEAILSMDYRCRNWIFNHGRFTSEFGNQIKRFCGTLGVTLPPSYQIYYPDHDASGHGSLRD